MGVSVELLEAYVETLVAYLQMEAPEYSTFQATITYYMTLRKAMQIQTTEKKHALDFQLEAERVLLGLLLMLEDNHSIKAESRIHYAWRLLDRVKFHTYRAENFNKTAKHLSNFILHPK